MDILRLQASARKLEYAAEAYDNHECIDDNCERCETITNSIKAAVEELPLWLVRIGMVLATIVTVVMWPYRQLTYLWCKLFHRHENYTPGKGSEE